MAEHSHTQNSLTSVIRRALALGAGAFSAIGLTAGAAAAVADLAPGQALSPMMAAASRLKGLGDLYEQLELADRDDEADAVSDRETEIADFLTDAPPSSVGDAAILLMVASAEIRANNFHEDGSYGFERGDIMVRRVMHFMADAAGINLHNYGGTYFLPPTTPRRSP